MEDIGTLEELVEMYENGELENKVQIDNDCVFVYDKDGNEVFNRFGSLMRVVQELLDYMDIPNEYV